MVTAVLLNTYKRIIDKFNTRLSELEGTEKLLDESLADAGLTEDEIAIVHEIAGGGGLKMEPFEQRLIDEHKELEDRLNKLNKFLSTPTFDGLELTEKSLLLAQKACMTGYYEVLTVRLYNRGLLEGGDAN